MNNQEKIQRNFGKKAAEYRSSAVHNNPTDLDRMISLLEPGPEEIALDVATGGGHTAIALASHVKKVVAVDITEEMLEQARSAANEKGVGNVEFRAEDVHHLSMEDASFDIVASRFAPHHFSDIGKAMRELCRVLKPGGRLYIYDCSTADGDEAEKIMNRIEWLRDDSHVYSYSERLWRRLLSALPLKIQEIDLRKDRYALPQWFDRMETPEEKREEIFHILSEMPETCRQLYPFDEKQLTTYRIEFLARKV